MNSRNIIGIILIIVGAGFLLGQFELWDFSYVIGTWYPVLIMAFAIYKISTDKNAIFFGIAVFVIGAVLLAKELGYLPWGFWSTIWPLLLILGGAWMLSGRRKKNGATFSGDQLNLNFVFSGAEEIIDSSNFKGGNISVLFGGVDIDLRPSQILTDGAYIELSVIFGGIDMIIPSNWKVETNGSPIFGALDNKTRMTVSDEKDNPVLKIKYTCLFGGIDIKN